MLKNVMRVWLGDFEPGELKKFGLLSAIFILVIGVYWALRPLKDSVFMAVVGVNYQPIAKWISLIVVFPLVLIYNKLIDIFPRQRMFYALCTIYAVLALIFAFLMQSKAYGLSVGVPSYDRWWGWAWYVYVESFGSLIVALFWAFAADTTKPESAVRGYPLVAFGGQLGNILGPLTVATIMRLFTHFEAGPEGELPIEAAETNAFVIAGLVVFAAMIMFAIMGLIWYFMKAVPKDQLVGYHTKDEKEKESEPGFFEGLKLIFSSGYLLGIFAIISAYEVIITVIDYNFKAAVNAQYPLAHQATEYLADYGMWVGIISMLSILLGINKIQKFMSLSAALALLPLLVTVAVLGVKMYPIIGVLFWIMVLSKAINYALNQPSMKQLYIPVSKDAKYKSQAFIEMYGSRGAKAVGSAVNVWRKTFIAKYGLVNGLASFISMCTWASLAIIGVWFPIALYLGRTYQKAVDHKKMIV
jgi:AAA family ATP:ADP antiporter